jgi:hypothetical protein
MVRPGTEGDSQSEVFLFFLNAADGCRVARDFETNNRITEDDASYLPALRLSTSAAPYFRWTGSASGTIMGIREACV